MILSRLLIIVLLFLAFDFAHAEVMDKEPSLIQNIVWSSISSAICLLVSRFKPWLLLVAVPLPAFYFLALISEIQDPFLGTAILKEAGELYIYNVYLFGALFVASIFVGLWWRSFSKKRYKGITAM